ncbi:hypothetical protein CVT25_006202 [Psilocybe cyanescens]|uniref:Uncharacterized protein n=1 Tax=Psilocybe cyanescens TaxID=93625 RepID=A0A409XKP7_PSICY|nr:hypothetical protein CVT25_006202 [Psilocybe cyanescens]
MQKSVKIAVPVPITKGTNRVDSDVPASLQVLGVADAEVTLDFEDLKHTAWRGDDGDKVESIAVGIVGTEKLEVNMLFLWEISHIGLPTIYGTGGMGAWLARHQGQNNMRI